MVGRSYGRGARLGELCLWAAAGAALMLTPLPSLSANSWREPLRDIYGILFVSAFAVVTWWVWLHRGATWVRIWAGGLWLVLIGPAEMIVFAPLWGPSGIALLYGSLVVGAVVACSSLAGALALMSIRPHRS
jgi:hypothetical protein